MHLNPLDGRYGRSTLPLLKYFSEESMVALKTEIEINYLVQFMGILGKKVDEGVEAKLRQIPSDISQGKGFARFKDFERRANHDIKAIEMYIAEESPEYKNYVHFGLTSQDINSAANSLVLHQFNSYHLTREVKVLTGILEGMALSLYPVVIPARTHGQMAVPTRLGKEIAVYQNRLKKLLVKLESFKFSCKMGGAVGNLSAHYAAYPEKDWEEFFNRFVSGFGLERNPLTTQVDSNISIAEHMQLVNNISLCLLDFCRDMWMYYSYGYFKKRSRRETVGSSTMPQKANPIEFENAEGNLELAANLLGFMANKFQVSRLQRDLSDSTVFRSMGVPFGYLQVAIDSIKRGVEVSQVDTGACLEDSKNHLMGSEWLQTMLRREGHEDPYNQVKKLSESGITPEEWDKRCRELTGENFDPVTYSRNRHLENK